MWPITCMEAYASTMALASTGSAVCGGAAADGAPTGLVCPNASSPACWDWWGQGHLSLSTGGAQGGAKSPPPGRGGVGKWTAGRAEALSLQLLDTQKPSTHCCPLAVAAASIGRRSQRRLKPGMSLRHCRCRSRPFRPCLCQTGCKE